MLIHSRWIVMLLAMHASVRAADNPRHIDLGPGITAVKTLEQNWTDVESNRFYNAAQGSRLVPYDWFLHLEEAGSQEPFRSAKHVRALGYIPRTPDPVNTDGLPVGFIKDASYDGQMAGLGLTCAACHTSQIIHNRTAYLIDGGPSLGDFERLMKALAAALQVTAENDAKFARFAAAVLPAGSSANDKADLLANVRSVADLRAKYNERNLPKLEKDHFGPGRVDAFGAIFNEVSVTFLNLPQNGHPANAPVSYPCLWDAPQHDRVQWNGAAENKRSRLGKVLFGTEEVGALGRNSGEVLGVFGNVEINAHEPLSIPRRYPSTVNKANLMAIENSLKKLWSPEWPEELGAINADSKAKGELLFKERCADCHQAIDRQDPDRKVIAQLSNVETDQNMIRNFGRFAKTGLLKGRRKTLLSFERMGPEEPIGVILKHVVERVILDPEFDLREIKQELLAAVDNPRKLLDLIDSLNPGYRMTATIEQGEKQLVGQFDSLIAQGQSLKVDGGRFYLMERGRDIAARGLGDEIIDLRSVDGILAAARLLEGVIAAEPANGQSAATLNNATAKIGYKARPLNGIWATAPYLHNGSVPNLVELLKPAAQRVKTFHVGSQEFDPVNVGFKDDPNQPLFDTNVDGNTNTGHEFGTDLNPEQRRQLLEYLKSL